MRNVKWGDGKCGMGNGELSSCVPNAVLLQAQSSAFATRKRAFYKADAVLWQARNRPFETPSGSEPQTTHDGKAVSGLFRPSCRTLRGRQGLRLQLSPATGGKPFAPPFALNLPPFSATGGANAFDQTVDAVQPVAFGQRDLGRVQVGKAVGAVATLTEEVHVLVLVVVLVMAVAQFVACSAVAVFDDVHQMVGPEQGQRTKDVRLVDGEDLHFQLPHRHGAAAGGQRPQDDDAVGGGLHAVTDEQLLAFLKFHEFHRIGSSFRYHFR